MLINHDYVLTLIVIKSSYITTVIYICDTGTIYNILNIYICDTIV